MGLAGVDRVLILGLGYRGACGALSPYGSVDR